MPPPQILYKLSPGSVFCLRSDPYRLAELRKVRDKHLSGATGDYAKPEFVRKEMQYAINIFNNHPQWPVIDVTSKPIEEIASEILTVIRRRK